jgi:integrase/recombinase XerD
MARKGQTTPKPPIGDVRDPNSLCRHMQRYGEWLRERQYSAATVESREIYLRYFIAWCDERGFKRPQDITKPILERYQRYLFLYRKDDGQPLSVRSQHTRIIPLRAWFKWLAKQNHILLQPGQRPGPAQAGTATAPAYPDHRRSGNGAGLA